MLKLTYDLHIHSCLSPCGDDDMTPANIVAMAALKNLDVIAVTDHNSCKNCPAVLSYAKQFNILAIPGMELCTREEVHVLCLFPSLDDAMAFDEYVSSKLLKVANKESIFGKQEIYDDQDCCIGTEPYLLVNATEITFDCLDKLMKEFHGIYIPAHIEKGSNSLLANLGFIPPESKFVCAEVMDPNRLDDLRKKHSYLNDCFVIHNSDAHSLGMIHEPNYILNVGGRRIEDILKTLNSVKSTLL